MINDHWSCVRHKNLLIQSLPFVFSSYGKSTSIIQICLNNQKILQNLRKMFVFQPSAKTDALNGISCILQLIPSLLRQYCINIKMLYFVQLLESGSNPICEEVIKWSDAEYILNIFHRGAVFIERHVNLSTWIFGFFWKFTIKVK